MGSGSGSDSEFVPLDGTTLPWPRGLVELGPVDLGRRITVNIHLRSNPDVAADEECDPDDDEAFSLEDFHRQYSASPADVELVIDYLKSLDFDIDNVQVHPDQCLIEVVGAVGAFNEAFGVELENYDSLRGKFFGHDGEIHVHRELLGIIDNVSGLDNLVTLSRVRAEESMVEDVADEIEAETRERSRSDEIAKSESEVVERREPEERDDKKESEDDSPLAYAETPRLSRSVSPTRRQGHKRSAAQKRSPRQASIDELIPPEYNLHDPAEVAKLYQFPEEYDGTGQTIGILSLDGEFDPKDITRYFAEQGIKKPTIVVETIGYRNPNAPRVHADDFEVTMDLQVAGSVAPGAKLVVYRVARGMPQPYLTALKYVATDTKHKPSIISISYGSAEGLFKARDLENSNKFFEYITKNGGITICAASGDGGSGSRDHDKMKPGPHVNFPASSPYVLACGGTALESSDGRIVREYAWNDHGQCRLATAGGISQVFERPEYQRKFTLPKNKSDRRGFDGRGVPDVAANACLTTGYRVLFNGRYVPNGGTSAAAPMWAGLIARLNQGLNRRLGFIHPHLYELAGTPALRDITEGSNGYYHSSQGWDACTGIGTPVGQELFAALKQKLGVKKGKPGLAGTGSGCLPTESQLATIVGAANSAAFMAQHAARLAQSAASGFRNPYRS